MASFIGILSSSRSELVYKKGNNLIDIGLQKGLSKTARNNKSMNFLSELVKVPLSFANNLFGVMTMTVAARELGLQTNKEITPAENIQYIHFEKITDNYSYLFSLPSI